jgi:hypothetical protein
MDEKFPLTILGRTVGEATGWDQADTMSFIYYGFVPNAGVKLPAGDMCVDYESGVYSFYDEDTGENVIATGDLLDAIKHL